MFSSIKKKSTVKGRELVIEKGNVTGLKRTSLFNIEVILDIPPSFSRIFFPGKNFQYFEFHNIKITMIK